MLKKFFTVSELENKVCIILGTRPEIIKMSPIIRALQKGKDYFLIHTGQHYSYNMDRVFFEELELPEPKYKLNIGEKQKTHGAQTGAMLIEIEKILLAERPKIVLVEGDTDTVLAGALAASKLRIPVGHVEAGLRSFDPEMPEETNRILTDHVSDYLFAPTENSKENLQKDGVAGKIFVVGNTIADATLQNIKLAKKKSDITKYSEYFLLTLHRQENVDRAERFLSVIKALQAISAKYGLPIIYPAHPRALLRIKEFGLEKEINKIKEFKLIDPVGYLDFLKLESGARLILTDSGGVQEEACILRVPCVVLRTSSDRPETIKAGAAVLGTLDTSTIVKSVEKMINKKRDWANPFGDGHAAEKILRMVA